MRRLLAVVFVVSVVFAETNVCPGLTDAGPVVGWGTNRPPPAGHNFAAIAAGSDHSLALKSDGTIVAWGNNDYGQADPCDGNDFVAIAAGWRHSLALKSDGTIIGWGYNGYGQATPPNGNDFVAIAAGYYHSLALKQNGTIVGWGRNNYGQATHPVGNDFVAIAAGANHSLALKSDGTIVGWGRNNYGQADPCDGNDFVAIAAGYYHSLALKSDGTIVAWGYNNYGQATPPDGNDFVAIAAGGYHSLALQSDGIIVAWGYNNYGQADPCDGNDFVAIAAGDYYSLALKSDGNIVGWGYNGYGQATPPDGNDFVAIAAGYSHALALKSDGSIVGWGWNNYGQADPCDGNDFVAISAGGNHSLALKSDGSIVGWGWNDYSQATPPVGYNFVATAAGMYHSLGLAIAQNEYTLTINTVGNGSVTKNPDQATYHYGDTVALTAIPAVGWSFDSWSGGLSGNTNPDTITIDGNETVTATFTMNVASELSVTKCLVKAGKTDNSDMILILGQMSATVGDFNDANNIQVTIDSNDMVNPLVRTFPINETTFKKGKYNYARTENASKKLFKYDTKTRKFSFMAKNVDLSGLGCPLTIKIEIGDYTGAAEANEAIVNGPRRPIPIKLMMGVKNSLRVDRYKVNRGKKPNTGQLSVKGGFAVEDPNVNLVNEEFVVTLGGQTFTLPASSFKAGKGKFTCSKANVAEGGIGIASATFNFTTCSFTITIKNITIEAVPGAANFSVEFADFSESVQIVLPQS